MKKPHTRDENVMPQEVVDMIALRRIAEQRGNFEPLGRLQWLKVEQRDVDKNHALIYFPADARTGEGCGPDLAFVLERVNFDCVDSPTGKAVGAVGSLDRFIVLGEWQGLPALRENTSKPCPKCRHNCDVCDGSGKKLCELCGGNKWTPGSWQFCPGPGCRKDTGMFKADCVTCRGSGQVVEERPCVMCDATGQMRCPRCIGTGKYSTGRVNGSVDWDASPKCKACDGTTLVGEWKRQDVKKFTNAVMLMPKSPGNTNRKSFLALGPIREFAIRDPQTLRTRLFAVTPDAANDLLMLLVPRSAMQRPQKAYLVGGIVRERSAVSMSA